MAFTGMLCLQIYYGLLLKEHLPRTQKKLERACLEQHCEGSLKFCCYSTTQTSLFLIERRSWNNECLRLWYALVFELTI